MTIVRRSSFVPTLALFFLAAFLLFFHLGHASLKDWDEGIYAQISKEMVQNKNWLTPHWMGQAWFEKPPLLIWSTAIVFKLFGVSEFGARLTTALCALGLCYMLPLFGDLIGSRWVGILAVLILLTTNEFLFRSRFGTMDVPLTFFIFVAFYAYLKVESGGSNWWYLAGIALGLAFLMKGAAAIVAPIVIGLSMSLDGKTQIRNTYRCPQFWLATLFAFVIVLPWHIVMELQHGRAFWDSYLNMQLMARMTNGVRSYYQGGRLFYFSQLQRDLFGWFFPSLFAIPLAIQMIYRKRTPAVRLLLLTVGVVFGLYTVAHTKNPWYMIPLYPALALLAASTWVNGIRERDPAALAALFFGCSLDALVISPSLVVLIGSLLMASCLLFWHTKISSVRVIGTVLLGGLLLVGALTLRPIYNDGESSVAHFGKMIKHQFPEDRNPIIIFGHPYSNGDPGPALAYYTDRWYQWAEGCPDLPKYIPSGETRDIFVGQKDLREVQHQYDVRILAEYDSLLYGQATMSKQPTVVSFTCP